jgi:hypothetical protein
MRIRTTTGPDASPLPGPNENSIPPSAATTSLMVGGGR